MRAMTTTSAWTNEFWHFADRVRGRIPNHEVFQHFLAAVVIARSGADAIVDFPLTLKGESSFDLLVERLRPLLRDEPVPYRELTELSHIGADSRSISPFVSWSVVEMVAELSRGISPSRIIDIGSGGFLGQFLATKFNSRVSIAAFDGREEPVTALARLLIDPARLCATSQATARANVPAEVVFVSPSWGQRLSDNVDDELGTLRRSESLGILTAARAITDGGRAFVFLPGGPLFRGGEDLRVRDWILSRGIGVSVVTLPAGLAAGTAIRPYLLVLDRRPPAQRVRLVNAARAEGERFRSTFTMTPSAIGEVAQQVVADTNDPSSAITLDIDELEAERVLDPTQYVSRDLASYAERIQKFASAGWQLLSAGDVFDRRRKRDDATFKMEGTRLVLVEPGVEPKGERSHTLYLEPKIGLPPEYFVSFFRSPLGRLAASAYATSSALPVLRWEQLKRIPIPVPPMEAAHEFAAVEKRLQLARANLGEVERALFDGPKALREATLRLDELGASDQFSAWARVFPYPIASLLRRVSTSSTPQQRLEVLLLAMEASTAYCGLLILSLYGELRRRGADLTLHKFLPDVDWSRFQQQPTFGAWAKVLWEGLAAYTRLPAHVDAIARDAIDPDLYDTVVTVAQTSGLKQALHSALKARNNDSHDGLASDETRSERLAEVEPIAAKLLAKLSPLLSRVLLVSGETVKRSGRWHATFRLLRGFDPAFKIEKRIVAEALDADRLYFFTAGFSQGVEALPLMLLGKRPDDVQDACFFLVRLGAQAEFVSYDFPHAKPQRFDAELIHAVMTELRVGQENL